MAGDLEKKMLELLQKLDQLKDQITQQTSSANLQSTEEILTLKILTELIQEQIPHESSFHQPSQNR